MGVKERKKERKKERERERERERELQMHRCAQPVLRCANLAIVLVLPTSFVLCVVAADIGTHPFRSETLDVHRLKSGTSH